MVAPKGGGEPSSLTTIPEMKRLDGVGCVEGSRGMPSNSGLAVPLGIGTGGFGGGLSFVSVSEDPSCPPSCAIANNGKPTNSKHKSKTLNRYILNLKSELTVVSFTYIINLHYQQGGFQNANYKLQNENFKLQISNYR
jgi:hypothetical protein